MTGFEPPRSAAWRDFLLLLAMAAGAFLAFVGGVLEATVRAAGCYFLSMMRVGLSLVAAPEADRETDDDAERDPARVEPDPAAPDYLHHFVFDDLRLVRKLTADGLAEYARTSSSWLDDVDTSSSSWFARSWITGRMVGLFPGFCLVVVLGAIHHGAALVLSGLWRLLGRVLRLLDSWLLRVRNVRMFCVTCFRPMPYPAYRCPTCRQTHWDIRPGRLGIAHRMCLCGTRLPTLLMSGSSKLDARCAIPSCGADLPHRPGTNRTLVLPIFGATAAGKTRLMYALLAALQEHPGVSVDTKDLPTALHLENVQDELDPENMTAPTQRALEQGLVVHVRVRRRVLHLHFFDVAGERFNTREGSEEHDFVRHARTFTMVVDPLSVKGFWDRQPGEEVKRLEKLPGTSRITDPEGLFHQATQGIRAVGGELKRARLALVFSRADQIGGAAAEDLEEWAGDMGLDTLLLAAREEFGKDVRVFHTAAVMADGSVHERVGGLLRWLMPGLTRIGPSSRKPLFARRGHSEP